MFEDPHSSNLFEAAAKEMRDAQPIKFMLDADSAVLVVAMLQMAIRHPDVPNVCRITTIDLCKRIIAKFPAAMRELSLRGFDARNDLHP